jgi:hypothetical protein
MVDRVLVFGRWSSGLGFRALAFVTTYVPGFRGVSPLRMQLGHTTFEEDRGEPLQEKRPKKPESHQPRSTRGGTTN